MKTQTSKTSIPANYRTLKSLTSTEWDMATKVEAMRPSNLNRLPEEQTFASWSRYKGMLSATAQIAEGLIHEARGSVESAAILKQVRLEAAQATSPKQWVSESAASHPLVLTQCCFRSDKEQSYWDRYASIRASWRGRRAIELAKAEIKRLRGLGWQHVTPGMVMDPVRLNPEFARLEPGEFGLQAIFDTAFLRDLEAMGAMPPGFVTPKESMWDRVPRILPHEQALALSVKALGETDALFG